MIRNPCLNRVHTSAFECSKVLVSPRLLDSLKRRNRMELCINPCIHAGLTHFTLIESLPLRQNFIPRTCDLDLPLAAG